MISIGFAYHACIISLARLICTFGAGHTISPLSSWREGVRWYSGIFTFGFFDLVAAIWLSALRFAGAPIASVVRKARTNEMDERRVIDKLRTRFVPHEIERQYRAVSCILLLNSASDTMSIRGACRSIQWSHDVVSGHSALVQVRWPSTIGHPYMSHHYYTLSRSYHL